MQAIFWLKRVCASGERVCGVEGGRGQKYEELVEIVTGLL